MIDQGQRDRAYRDELRRWVPALVGVQAMNGVCEALDPGSSPAGLKLFAEGNLGKRREKLHAQLEFVAEAFDDFEDLASAYIRSVPPAAYDTTASDGERFLSWLERAGALTPRQRDYVACQRARLGVEAAARADRRGHLGFQELWNSALQRAATLDMAPGLRVYLNPSRAWSQFITAALLDDDATLPADVLFFAAGEAIRTAVLEPNGRALIEELASCGPCTFDEWAALSRHADRRELVEFCRDLAEMGLVAFD
ncbi:MAG: hypothetical protein HYX69_09080 [Planctomycetia bacterium]|nr:hypothetical protein [Planctomycetia bacterium]